MQEKPFVFIGSSTEGLEVAKGVQTNLDFICECQIWSQGLFGLSGGTLETLVNSLKEFDFAILVLTEDDITISRGNEQKSPRDNVIFELGLFIGGLGRERTFIVTERQASLKLPTDLAGLTPATYDPPKKGTIQSALGAACHLLERVIKRLGGRNKLTDSLSIELGNKNSEVTEIPNSLDTGGKISNEITLRGISTMRILPKVEPVITKVIVKNNKGDSIEEAQIVLIADNSTWLECRTDKDGIGNIEVKTRRSYTALIAHPNYPSVIFENFDIKDDLEVTIFEEENIGSVVIHSTGYIPNLKGRLNPILDTGDRKYLYADNIAINGGMNQPVTFELDKIVNLEDSEGAILDVIFRFMKGRTSLLDYIKPFYE